MNDVEGIPELRDIRGRIGVKVGQGKLNYWRWIDYSAVTLTETTCSSGQRLLANGKLVAACAVHGVSILTRYQ